MTAVYAVCAGVGTLLIVLQMIGGAIDHDADHHHHFGDGGEGLHLKSMRAIAVGLAVFGFTGLVLARLGIWGVLVFPAALAVGGTGLVTTAWLLARVARLEHDASVRVADALGERGTVYIPIAPDVPGKVQLTARGRTVEYPAVAREALATGTAVVVVGMQDGATLEVERA